MTTSAVNVTAIEARLQSLEQYLAQLEGQLLRAQRLAVVGTMASMIAHEFNNLLTPVVSYSQFALDKDDPQLREKALRQAYRSGKRAVEVAQQLLGFARGADDGEAADVRETIDSALAALVRDLSKDNIALNLEVGSITVAVSVRMLQQVVYNLILNARQAMIGKPGSLTIKAWVEGDRAHLTVSDTGPGIDPAVAPRIFDPFFSTKTDNTRADLQGSGLGLAISRHIVERAGGTLTVDQTGPDGTTFRITAPLAEAK